MRTRLGNRANWVVRRLAASERAARAAARVRNQCNLLMGYHLAPSPAFDLNGEAKLLDRAAPYVSTFIDVGANVGGWTNALLARQPAATGVLVEPTPDALKQLRANVPNSMKIIAAAASHTAGTMTFYDEGGASEQSAGLAALTTNGQPIEVPVVTVDGILTAQGWDLLDMLKIDAQGYDAHVLAGAGQALERRAITIIQFEYDDCWEWAGSTLLAAIEMLRCAGYAVWALRPEGVVPYDPEPFGEFFAYSNFVATTPAGTAIVAS